MKLVNSSIKFERKTRTPDHSNPTQTLQNPPFSQNPHKTKANLQRTYEKTLEDLLKDGENMSFSAKETEKDVFWLKMKNKLTKKKSKLRKMQIISLKSQIKILQNQQLFMIPSMKSEKNVDFIERIQEKMLELKLENQQKSSQNRKLKEKLIKMNDFLLKNEKIFEKSSSNLTSFNILNENLLKPPAFDDYFQSSASQMVKNNGKNLEKASKLEAKTVLCNVFTKICEIKKNHFEIKENYVFLLTFLQKNGPDFNAEISAFLNKKLKDYSERIEQEKKEYMLKIEEESIFKLQTVQEKYESAEKEQKAKLEQDNAKNEQIKSVFQTLLNEKLREKSEEIQVLKGQLDKNKLFPLNNRKDSHPNKKMKQLEQSNLVLNELLRNTKEELKKMRVFYEEKFVAYDKKMEEIMKLQEEIEQNNNKSIENIDQIPKIDYDKSTTIIPRSPSIKIIDSYQPTLFRIDTHQPPSIPIELHQSPKISLNNYETKKKLNFIEDNEKNRFAIFEEVQSKFNKKEFEKKFKESKIKYEEIIKRLTEENFELKEEKEKVNMELTIKEKEFKDVFNENLSLKVEKMNFEEKLKKNQETIREKEYQFLVKNTIAANHCEQNESALIKEFKKVLSPLVITKNLHAKCEVVGD